MSLPPRPYPQPAAEPLGHSVNPCNEKTSSLAAPAQTGSVAATQALNPRLFAQLEATFGEVRVSNRGQQRVMRPRTSWRTPGRTTTQRVSGGEQYRVCCPLCNDRRFRLYISHTFATTDPQGNLDLSVWCQNEKCTAIAGIPTLLIAMIRQQAGDLTNQLPTLSGTPKSVASAEPPAPVALPSPLTALSSLPDDHPAIQYLAGRGFDPEYLERNWQVAYCQKCPSCDPEVYERLVYPVWQPKRNPDGSFTNHLASWQARTLNNQEPRYLNLKGSRKSEFLYGLCEAIQSTGPVCFVEGPFDAWRLGPGAVALFGNVLHDEQVPLIVRHFAQRPLVVMLDGTAAAEAELVCQKLSVAFTWPKRTAPIVRVQLPDDLDPADCDRGMLLQLIAHGTPDAVASRRRPTGRESRFAAIVRS